MSDLTDLTPEEMRAGIALQLREIDRLRVQCKMLQDDKAALLESMASERHRAFLLAERVKVLEEALQTALKWGAALSSREYARCREALKRGD
jgi:hypothetical protein